MKICTTCNISKLENCFGILKSAQDGFRAECKECRSSKQKISYKKDSSKFKIRKQKWKEKNPENYKNGNHKYYENHIEHIKNYASEHKKQIKENHKRWSDKNRSKENSRLYKLYIKKYKQDLSFRLRCNISRMINFCLKKQDVKKNNSTWSKLPYSPQELKKHLEKQFDENMNWDNYGTYWNIDHIYPQSKFDFSDNEQIIKCWALENLRPLEKIENIRKGNKLL